MFPLARCDGPALYEPLVIAKVSFGGSPPSVTMAVKVHDPPQLPLNVAVVPTTFSVLTDVLTIVFPLAGSE